MSSQHNAELRHNSQSLKYYNSQKHYNRKNIMKTQNKGLAVMSKNISTYQSFRKKKKTSWPIGLSVWLVTVVQLNTVLASLQYITGEKCILT